MDSALHQARSLKLAAQRRDGEAAGRSTSRGAGNVHLDWLLARVRVLDQQERMALACWWVDLVAQAIVPWSVIRAFLLAGHTSLFCKALALAACPIPNAHCGEKALAV